MLIYNITVNVENKILDEWMLWQKETHIPEIIETGCFNDHRFYELLEQDTNEGKTFVIQFYAYSRKDYDRYLENFALQLREKNKEKWNEQVMSFRTLLQNVQ